MTERLSELSRLRRGARWTALRLRVDETLARASTWLPLPLVYLVGALTYVKVTRASVETATPILAGVGVPLAVYLVVVLHAWFKRRPRHAGSLALDRHHDLSDRVTNALTFDAVSQNERSALMDAAIDDALAVAKDLRPGRAAPIHVPKDLPVAVLLSAAVVGVSLFEVRTERYVAPAVSTVQAMEVSPDDIELFRDMAEDLEKGTNDPEVKAAVRRFNQLVEDIADRRLDRREVFRRLEDLERGLVQASETEDEAFDEGIDGIAKALQKSRLSKPIAEELEQKQLADAEEAMRDLADKLANRKKKVDEARLEELRRSLEEASKASQERMERLEAKRQELEERRKRLLKKKEKKKKLSKQEKRELQKNERRLERLRRDKKRAESRRRQMTDLDRDLAKAARDLMKDLGMSAKDLEQGAQDLNRAARQQMTKKEKQELKRRLEELREILRQQGKGGDQRMARMLRFGQKARGGKPAKGQGQEQGKGKGQQRGRSGGNQRLVLGLGQPGGKGIELPMPGTSGSMPGEGDRGEGGGTPGSEWGTEHDPNVRGDETRLDGQTQDVTAAAADTGQGAAASEVIFGAADRGFVGRGYKKVFTDYKTVAEEVLERDEIPPGYEFYVRRYFQLIRPRE